MITIIIEKYYTYIKLNTCEPNIPNLLKNKPFCKLLITSNCIKFLPKENIFLYSVL